MFRKYADLIEASAQARCRRLLGIWYGMSAQVSAAKSITFLLASGLATALGAAEPGAEYAIRWSPRDGGPASINQVFEILGLKAGKPADYVVQYYDPKRPQGAPNRFDAIVRERIGTKVEVTWKYRGGSSAPPGAETSWSCPLRKERKRKDELDISILAGGGIKRAYSRSCTSEGSLAEAAPAKLKLKPRGCSSKMARLETKDESTTVERWELSNGEVVLEVSKKGPSSVDTLATFQSGIAAELIKRGVKPIDRSKTDISTQC